MKRYSDYLDAITPSEIYEGLLGYGLFSEKLPPVFSSESFYSYCLTMSPDFIDKWRQHIYYESMRNTNVPRQLGIPNPMAYQKLCKCISDNWIKMQFYFKQKTKEQKHIISRIHLRKMPDTKSLFKMNYENWKTDGTPEPDFLIGSRYIVYADISTCFPSIYTHSIPWALVGKDIAKTRAGSKYKKEWYNQIDHYTQCCKNGETHGVLIGPHASNLIGEIILTCVDSELAGRWKYIRNIDDYTCYVEDREKAQLFLVELATALRKYDLTLNYKKTEIHELPMAMTEQWVRQVGNPLEYLRKGVMDYIAIRSYLDNAIEVMQRNKENSAIINYAIKAIPKDNLSLNAVDYCVKLIFHLCLLYPYLLQIMDKYVFVKFHVTVEQIQSFSEKVYKRELSRRNYDGVCYALFFALKYDFLIDSVKAQDAIDSDSCLFRLMSFLYFKKNTKKTEIMRLRKLAKELKSDDDLGQNWLFVYEALTKKDLPDEWKMLKENNVSFLKNEYQF